VVGQKPTSVGVAALGIGPNDGFTGTWQADFSPRWGDYGYAVAGGDGSIWLGAGYTQSKCNYEQWVNDITCGFSRGVIDNWSTRLTQVATG
jgi:hypothetical protein